MKKVFLGFGLIVMGVALFSLYGKEELNIAKKVGGVTSELEFVVVVPSFNNDAYFERNLNSILSQDYKNYEVVYIEDCSTDNTFKNVSEYVEGKNFGKSIKIIRNSENRKALYNLYTAIHDCSNDKIIVLLDGDDWFADEHVLSTLNEYYQNQDMWMSYGQYIRYPDYQMGMCKPVTKSFLKRRKMRQNKWQYSHLRTFYAGLFKRIKLSDLVEKGSFFTAAWDHAIMFPMLEMAREHAYFTPDVFYVYNYETPLTDAKIRLQEQERVAGLIKQMPRYSPLTVDPRAPFEQGVSDLVVFSYNRPMQLFAFLESAKKNVTGFRKIGVIYRADPDFWSGYEEIKYVFPEVQFFRQSNETPKEDFKPLVLETTYGKFGQGADYIAFAVDDIIITDQIDVLHGALKLKETGAYGLFYRLGRHVDYCYMLDQYQGVPNLLEVGGGCLAWQFETAKGDWNYANSVDLVLYAKNDIRKELESIKYTFPNDFEGEWSKFADASKFGLCYERAKMVNIPMNIVSTFRNRAAHTFSADDLNDLFEEGLKIDIAPFYHILNPSAHADIQPQFIPRTQ